MQTLSKKTTILFSPDLYQQLKDIAKTCKISVAELIRQAAVKQYLLSDKKKRLKAVEHLSKIGGSIPNWQTLEEEMSNGRLNPI
ncbi:MAG: ribbon-helix-helix domain-containing protein [Patescibacteria group bacterium]